MRMHPVLGFMKMHNGTDFAAPVGTPIYAAGDGVVEFSGLKGPNGNFTKILHPNGWETLYLHKSLILPGVSPARMSARARRSARSARPASTAPATRP